MPWRVRREPRSARLRRLARASLPPALYRSARSAWIRTRPESERPWRYLPDGWPSPENGIGWNGPAVAEAYRAKWAGFRDALDGVGPFGVIHEIPLGGQIRVDDPSAELLGVAFSYVLARAAGREQRLRVLDYGGALGHYALIARANLPDLELDYHVRELREVCAVGRELVPDVIFHDSDACLAESYDVVFASGTLECLADWRSELARLARAASRYVYLTRVPIARHEPSFVCLQRVDMYGYSGAIPFWVINRRELLAEAKKLHVALVREFVTGEEDGDISGAPERRFPSRGFLFASSGGRHRGTAPA